MMIQQWRSAFLCMAVLSAGVSAAKADVLDQVKARRAIDAQRVEREFAEGRSAAYKLVRSADPQPAAAAEKLTALLDMVENDTSLEARRRRQLVVTLKWDLDKVKEIASERRRVARVVPTRPTTTPRSEPRREYREDRSDLTRRAQSIIDARRGVVRGASTDRADRNESLNRALTSVRQSAVPDSRNYVLPDDWAEKSRKRSTGVKMTAKEKAILASLNKTISVEFKGERFSDVIDYMSKLTGINIAVDKRGLQESVVSYDSTVTLKMRSSARTVFRRILADLGLAYFIKDEVMQVTSVERARQTTTVRTYYIGDLAAVADIRIPYFLGQLQMIETVNRIITLIKQNVEPQSWRDNNPEAPGTITFDPITMTLVVKQSAEFHFLMGGK